MINGDQLFEPYFSILNINSSISYIYEVDLHCTSNLSHDIDVVVERQSR
jgi:hypothetical protein